MQVASTQETWFGPMEIGIEANSLNPFIAPRRVVFSRKTVSTLIKFGRGCQALAHKKLELAWAADESQAASLRSEAERLFSASEQIWACLLHAHVKFPEAEIVLRLDLRDEKDFTEEQWHFATARVGIESESESLALPVNKLSRKALFWIAASANRNCKSGTKRPGESETPEEEIGRFLLLGIFPSEYHWVLREDSEEKEESDH